MSNIQNVTKTAIKATEEQSSPPTSFELSLDEFCTRLSGGRVGPELIGGFYQSQKSSGNIKSTDAAFTAAFDVFVKQPA